MLSGRGAVDMKGAIAAFLSAAHRHLASSGLGTGGTISLLITGDEEGEAIDGTSRILQWMAERQIRPDFCVVGEPTSQSILGDTIKIGRRGSLNGRIAITGAEGHVAYPHLAHNPIPILLAILNRLLARRFDDKCAQFDASNLEVVSIDVGNTATNVIPGQAKATFNIRFNTAHSGQGLCEWIRREAAAAAAGQNIKIDLDLAVSGEPFLTEPGVWTDMMREAIRAVTGRTPVLSTTGGTSDARFISRYFPVAEFGLVGHTMHKPNECVSIAELEQLSAIYSAMLNRFFGGARS
jgi:succinyl-diaminopimelate desuccinylase